MVGIAAALALGKTPINPDYRSLTKFVEIYTDALSPSEAHPGFQFYKNSRFGFSVLVPNSLRGRPVPREGDGRAFLSDDGETRMSVVCGNQHTSESTSAIFGHRTKRLSSFRTKPRYQELHSRWFALSYQDWGRIVYEKGMVSSKGMLIELYFRYPASQGRERERELKVVAASLAPAPGS